MLAIKLKIVRITHRQRSALLKHGYVFDFFKVLERFEQSALVSCIQLLIVFGVTCDSNIYFDFFESYVDDNYSIPFDYIFHKNTKVIQQYINIV